MAAVAPRVEAVVFDLLYTLVHPGAYPGGVGRIGWLAGILGVESSALRDRWRAFEPVLEAGRAARTESGTRPETAWLEVVAAELGAGIGADDRALIEADWDLTRRQARSAPAELPRLRAQADAGVSVLCQVLDLISS